MMQTDMLEKDRRIAADGDEQGKTGRSTEKNMDKNTDTSERPLSVKTEQISGHKVESSEVKTEQISGHKTESSEVKTGVNYERNLRRENDGKVLQEIRMIRRDDPDYPPQFMHYARMPASFYVLGGLPDPERKTVAIVGARGCSSYGKEQAMLFGRKLAQAGVQVISGMAYGIDAFGQTGALDGGGRVYAVLGTGVDVCYPRQNYPLYRRILREGGGIISEFEPGTPPDGWHFPIRNRLISALADVVLVVEARPRSGSLITADYAMEQGKSIYAVPGRNGDDLSCGCNRLIAQGAGIAWTPAVILEELGFTCEEEAFWPESVGSVKDDADGAEVEVKKRVNKPRGGKSELPARWEHADDFGKIFGHLESSPKSMHVLITQSGLSPSTVASTLMQLCVSGYVEESAPGYFRRK